MQPLKFSYFQLTFGQEETYLHPEKSYARLKKCGYGTVDFKAVIRAIKKTGYAGYCTIESAPMVPDADTAARDGIEYLKLLERIVAYQISAEYPNGFAV
jgi:hypothetical protein